MISTSHEKFNKNLHILTVAVIQEPVTGEKIGGASGVNTVYFKRNPDVNDYQQTIRNLKRRP
jgi:hypothetical protein